MGGRGRSLDSPAATGVQRKSGEASASPLLAFTALGLGDDDSEGSGSSRKAEGRRGKLGERPAIHGECGHCRYRCIDDVQPASARGESSVKWTDASSAAEWSASQQGKAAVRRDLEAGDGRACGIDGEEILSVVTDLDPARRSLVVGVRRCSDRAQRTVRGHVEGGDGAAVRRRVVRV
jgi:hypothetical protein